MDEGTPEIDDSLSLLCVSPSHKDLDWVHLHSTNYSVILGGALWEFKVPSMINYAC